MWSARTLVHSAYAHGMEVADTLYFTQTGIVNYYCSPAGRISVTLLIRPFLSFCVGGAGVQDYFNFLLGAGTTLVLSLAQGNEMQELFLYLHSQCACPIQLKVSSYYVILF